MTFFISITFILLFVSVVLYAKFSFYEDPQYKIWKELSLSYPGNDIQSDNGDYKIQMIFFRRENEKKFDHVNSMKVAINESGFSFKPTLATFFLEPVFIPIEKAIFYDRKRLFIQKRDVYKVEGHDIYIAI